MLLINCHYTQCPSVVESLLSPGDVNPLMLACLCGHHQLAELLLKHGTGLALRGDGRGMSAVHYATWSGSVKCVKTVSSHTSWRQAVAQRDMWGRTPLITAAAKVRNDRLLLQPVSHSVACCTVLHAAHCCMTQLSC